MSTAKKQTPAQKKETRKKRQYDKQDGKCYYCTSALPMKKLGWEHMKTRKSKGANALYNLVLACRECDLLKGSISTVAEAEAYVEDLIHFWRHVEKNGLLPRHKRDYPDFYKNRGKK